MNGYVAQKEYLCLPKNSEAKQRNSRFITRRRNQQDRETTARAVELLMESFNGTLVSSLNEELFIA